MMKSSICTHATHYTVDGSEDFVLMPNDHVLISSVSFTFSSNFKVCIYFILLPHCMLKSIVLNSVRLHYYNLYMCTYLSMHVSLFITKS